MSRGDGRGSAWAGIALAAAVAAGAAWSAGFEFTGGTGKNLRALSDAFLAAGAVTAGIWALGRIASTGFFDLFSYSFRELGSRLNPARRREAPERFYDYKARAAEKRKNRGYSLLFTGLGCLALSVLFLVLFHSVKG